MSNIIFPENTEAKQRKLLFNNTQFNDRHRKYGNGLVAYDIDLMEFDFNAKPIAIFESKHGSIKELNLDLLQFDCLRNLAEPHNIPVYCVVYYFPGVNEANGELDPFGNNRKFLVVPANKIALEQSNNNIRLMTELEFVTFIYDLRKMTLYDNFNLDNEIDFKLKLPSITFNNHTHWISQ